MTSARCIARAATKGTEAHTLALNREKVVAALFGVVDAAAHLDGHGNVIGHHIAGASHDFQRDGRLAEVKSATTASQHFLDRAAEVDVDHIEPGLHQLDRAGGKLLWLRSHQLTGHRRFIVASIKEVPSPPGCVSCVASATRFTMSEP